MVTRRGFVGCLAGVVAAAGALTGRAAAAPVTPKAEEIQSFAAELLLRERPISLAERRAMRAEVERFRREILAQQVRMREPIWTLDGTQPPMPPGLVEKAPMWVRPR